MSYWMGYLKKLHTQTVLDEEYYIVSKVIKKNLDPLSKEELIDLLIRYLTEAKP